MQHVAVMKKSWGMLPKILSGEKSIESRWSKNKSAPWGKVKPGETIYFKNSGEPVSARSKVLKVLSFQDLTPWRVKEILRKYGSRDGIKAKDRGRFYQPFKDKKYCSLIFLRNPQKIKPFDINKKGFGLMAAWLTVKGISSVKIPFR